MIEGFTIKKMFRLPTIGRTLSKTIGHKQLVLTSLSICTVRSFHAIHHNNFWKVPKEDDKEKKETTSSWIGSFGSSVGGYLNQVKETVASAGDTISNTAAIQYLNNLITYLKEINIVKLEKEAEEKALIVINQKDRPEEEAQNEEEKIQQEQRRKILLSFNDVFKNNEHPIHHMKIEKGGFSSVLNYIPFFSHVELMFKYVVYQSLNIVLEAITYSKVLNREQKDEMVDDVSKIIIKNSLDPMGLAVDLVEYVSLKLGADEKMAGQLKYVTSLLPYMKNVVGFMKKFK